MSTGDMEFPREISAKTPLDAHLRTIEEHLTKKQPVHKNLQLGAPLGGP